MSFGLKEKKPKPWHPDFRDENSLPDVKVVRTEFMINLVSVMVAIALLIYYFIQFSLAGDIQKHIDYLSKDIENHKTQNVEFVKKSSRFVRESKLLKTFRDFFEPSINPLDFLIVLAENKHPDLLFEELNFTEKNIPSPKKRGNAKGGEMDRVYLIDIDGSIEGGYEGALETMNTYLGQLSALPKIKEKLKDIEMISLMRDPDLGLFNYSIRLTLNPTKNGSVYSHR